MCQFALGTIEDRLRAARQGTEGGGARARKMGQPGISRVGFGSAKARLAPHANLARKRKAPGIAPGALMIGR
ncbi:hypothetical protein WJ59_23990 [Burkholderia gladioli]|nr:hypothetical protein LA03_22715 [Burkholderia gladioli]KVM63216.1 hypothetical protein WJ59_23990 [Burkholderia gladioli]